MTTHRPDDYHFDPRSREHKLDPEETQDTDPRRDEFRRWRHASLDSLARAKSQLLCLRDVCDSHAVRKALADLNALTAWTENLRLSYDAGLEEPAPAEDTTEGK